MPVRQPIKWLKFIRIKSKTKRFTKAIKSQNPLKYKSEVINLIQHVFFLSPQNLYKTGKSICEKGVTPMLSVPILNRFDPQNIGKVWRNLLPHFPVLCICGQLRENLKAATLFGPPPCYPRGSFLKVARVCKPLSFH